VTELTTITTKGGARFTVAKQYAPRFEALLNDLEASGYAIDPKQSGGYNPRNIAGTNTPSQHSYGRAVDVNWTRNALGTDGDIDPALAQELSTKHGFTWGGSWKSKRDPMHFEVSDAAASPPVAQRSLVAYAGNASPVPAPSPAPDVAPSAPEQVPAPANAVQQFADALTSRVADQPQERQEPRPEDDMPDMPQLRISGMDAQPLRRRVNSNSLLRAVASRLNSSGSAGV
jgi:hypothetical protein